MPFGQYYQQIDTVVFCKTYNAIVCTFIAYKMINSPYAPNSFSSFKDLKIISGSKSSFLPVFITCSSALKLFTSPLISSIGMAGGKVTKIARQSYFFDSRKICFCRHCYQWTIQMLYCISRMAAKEKSFTCRSSLAAHYNNIRMYIFTNRL